MSPIAKQKRIQSPQTPISPWWMWAFQDETPWILGFVTLPTALVGTVSDHEKFAICLFWQRHKVGNRLRSTDSFHWRARTFDCILTKSLLASSKVARASINSNFPLSLKGADLSCLPHSLSTFYASADRISTSRCFCCALEFMSDKHVKSFRLTMMIH